MIKKNFCRGFAPRHTPPGAYAAQAGVCVCVCVCGYVSVSLCLCSVCVCTHAPGYVHFFLPHTYARTRAPQRDGLRTLVQGSQQQGKFFAMKTFTKLALLIITLALGMATWFVTSWQSDQVDRIMAMMDVDRNGMLQTEEASPLMRLRFSELDSACAHTRTHTHT